MMDGRIKTLHPGVHAGILARRDRPEHIESLREHDLREIDLVCCNLYPFVETVTRPGVTFEEAVEQIDIGGPAMIRAAAKNHESVLVVVRPERYSDLLAALNEGTVDAAMRRRLAAEAFAHTSAYDSWIAAYLRGLAPDGFPPEISFAGLPHPTAEVRRERAPEGGVLPVRAEPGRRSAAPCSCRAKSSDSTTSRMPRPPTSWCSDYDRPAAAIVKHMNPCGLAVADDIAKAYRLAYECDTVSAFGGIVSVNRPLDRSTAEQIVQIVTHVVIAPEVLDEARDVLARRKTMIVLAAQPPARKSIRLRRALGAGRFSRPGLGSHRFRPGSVVGGDPALADRQPNGSSWDSRGSRSST